MHTKNRAIFIDRDGVINDTVDRGENHAVQGKKVRWSGPYHRDEFHLRDGVEEALARMKSLGFLRVLVTNQPDVGYGVLPQEEYDHIMAQVRELPFDDIFICLHGRTEGCVCKKPKPGMLLAAAEKHGIDLASSFMIGDTENDAKAGAAAGCATIIIDYEHNRHVAADMRALHLADAVRAIEDIINITV